MAKTAAKSCVVHEGLSIWLMQINMKYCFCFGQTLPSDLWLDEFALDQLSIPCHTAVCQTECGWRERTHVAHDCQKCAPHSQRNPWNVSLVIGKLKISGGVVISRRSQICFQQFLDQNWPKLLLMMIRECAVWTPLDHLMYALLLKCWRI